MLSFFMGLACFYIFLMLVERDIMGLILFYFYFYFFFLVGVFFNKIFYIMT